MNKKFRNTLIISGSVITLSVLAYFLFFKDKNKDKDNQNGDGVDRDEYGMPIVSVEVPFPLKKGRKGPAVRKLQKFLNDTGSHNLTVDGDFGTLTENAVKTEQTPFNVFKQSFPDAVFGQVTKDYYDLFIRNFY
tara:strand:- start:8855 stop:9256 length:402 start_codon:yes stop_codon:yes gene_type:complete